MATHFLLPPLIDLADEDLVTRWQEGDVAALETLLRRYHGLARAKATTYFLVGADRDDVEQESLIGLFKAARDYQPGRQASFRAFAELCVTRQIISAIKAATRQKHQPLNQYVSISGGREPDDPTEQDLAWLLGDGGAADPADEVVSREQVASMRRLMVETLSGLEVEVLQLHMDGRSYEEISERLGRRAKSVDNALQRIRRKLDQRLHDDQDDRELALAS